MTTQKHDSLFAYYLVRLRSCDWDDFRVELAPLNLTLPETPDEAFLRKVAAVKTFAMEVRLNGRNGASS